VKKIGAVVGAIVVGLIVFAIGAGVVAALLAVVGETGWSPSPGVSIALGLLLDVLKWGTSIWSGYRAYQYLMRKNSTAEAAKR
jgi:hypothetical protein